MVRIIININATPPRRARRVLGGALLRCAGRLPSRTPPSAVRAAQVWPGTTVTDLHRGKQRYVQSCSSCHGLIDPHQFEAGRWHGFVKEMSGRMQLSSNDLTDLTRYLVVASESPPTH